MLSTFWNFWNWSVLEFSLCFPLSVLHVGSMDLWERTLIHIYFGPIHTVFLILKHPKKGQLVLYHHHYLKWLCHTFRISMSLVRTRIIFPSNWDITSRLACMCSLYAKDFIDLPSYVGPGTPPPPRHTPLQWDIGLMLPRMLVASSVFILNWKLDVFCINRCWVFSPCSFSSSDFVKSARRHFSTRSAFKI